VVHINIEWVLYQMRKNRLSQLSYISKFMICKPNPFADTFIMGIGL